MSAGLVVQKRKPIPPPSEIDIRSSDAAALDRVVAIARAPLLPGEKETDYLKLAAGIVSTAKPWDTIEELLIRDVIDLNWEIFRLRRAKVGILRASMGKGLEKILERLGHSGGLPYKYTQLSQSWAAGDKTVQEEVARALNAAGLTIEEVTAKTLECQLDSFERLDRMIASAEARRNNALREVDRHRHALGAAVRSAIDAVEDVEFRDVETGETSAQVQE
jgi:hypothetical protein